MNEKPFEPANIPNWIACIRGEIRTGMGRVTCPAYPLLELLEELEKRRAADALGKCQNEFGPCVEHCGQCKAAPVDNCWQTAENR